ncbi:hybrid sensor histidine kinase/response regulator [Synechocystis sp. LKSZ1]|uniref:hybrid sensor histidine kinase/response regulator n=1 Tax=Synechocystis sp. LKSZ1 TaxID=3144951 RepID=UPI00336BC28C
MFIEDEELRHLYQVASTEHLSNLEAGLLWLESHPQDRSKLEELLREAHSLKGDSRMLGVSEAESLTHHLEEVLSAIHQGQGQFSPQVCDGLLQGVDAIKKIAQEAVTGEPSQVSVFHTAAQLMTLLEESSEPLVSNPTMADLSSAWPLESLSQNAPEDDIEALLALVAEPATSSLPSPLLELEALTEPVALTSAPTIGPEAERLDTIRVDGAKLDQLVNHAGELTVTQQRMQRQLEVLQTLHLLWENTQRASKQGQALALEGPHRSPLQQHFAQIDQALEKMGQCLQLLTSQTQTDTTRLEIVTEALERDVRKLQLLPFATIFNLFPRTVRDLSKQQNKDVQLHLQGSETAVDRRILDEIKAPLTHLLRNAIDHGLETPAERTRLGKPPQANLWLRGYSRGSEIVIEVQDDGRGLDDRAIGETAVKKGLLTPTELALMAPEQIQSLIFRPGFSTKSEVSAISGRGVGLDVVKASVEKLQGELAVESQPGQGCRFRILLRANRSVIPVLLVSVQDHCYALPVDGVALSFLFDPQQIFQLEGRPCILWQGQPLLLKALGDIVGQPMQEQAGKRPCVVLKGQGQYQGLIVDRLWDYQEIQLKNPNPLLSGISLLLGATILSTGEVCHVLNPSALLEVEQTVGVLSDFTPAGIRKPRVLLVEDSLPIRTQLRRILEGAGYEVAVAVDGREGLAKVQAEGPFAALVSDVEMPYLSGFELTEQIRRLGAYDQLPIILVTTLAKEDDRRRGLDAGANDYLTKGDFDQSLLLDSLRKLIYEQN